ncbi:MAG: pseudouridine synthase [Myxococcota bacterium]|nr:pseudouridine synthase [Myxococcota bacterium]
MRVLISAPRYVVVDKPSGLSVHKGWDASPDTVMRRLRADLGRWVYPVHRLDRATSGVLIMALDPECAGVLSAAFREGRVEKEYVALVRGALTEPGRVDHAIPSHVGGERVDAITDYAPLAIARERYTLVRAWPRTGKSHQIRRHMKHLSRPLLGDTTYGDGKENRAMREQIGLHRLALHASSIAFPDPESGERVEASAPLPDDLRAPLERLGFAAELLDAIGASTPAGSAAV